MAVVKCGNIAFHIGETPETIIRLKKTFGKDNVYERSWYSKEYDVNGKKVPVVMAASYSILIGKEKGEWKWTPSDRNRTDRRLAARQRKIGYGIHYTKHTRTKRERKKEKLNREAGQRNSKI